MAGLIVLFLIVAVIVVLLAVGPGRAIYVVPQQTVAIIERLGKFNRCAGAGLHVKIPIIEQIACRVDMRISQNDFAIDAKTQDNVTVTMSIAAQYRVKFGDEGVWRSYYMLDAPVAQMKAYLIDALRSSVPQYTLDDVFNKKDSIARDVNETVQALMGEYGFDVVSTLITGIQLPKDVEKSMNSINSAQRDREAAIALAEAEKIKVVTEAQAKAESMELAGRGIAAQRKAIAEGIKESLNTISESGVGVDEANKLFMFTQWADMMTEYAKTGQTSTVVLPADFNQSASMFEQQFVAHKAAEGDK